MGCTGETGALILHSLLRKHETHGDDEQDRIKHAVDEWGSFSVLYHSLDSIVQMFLDKKRPKIDQLSEPSIRTTSSEPMGTYVA